MLRRKLKVLALGVIILIVLPFMVIAVTFCELFGIHIKGPKEEENLAKKHAKSLEEMAHRMRVLYGEVPVSDIWELERIAEHLREKGYGKNIYS